MTSANESAHPLALKVMRVSRPSLASAWEPFYSSSPSFSAHSSASILSLQGSAPLTGNPKTLRDLSHATELLTLPSTFGAIQLGETFSSCLCLNNETTVDVEAVTMKVEMQTATTKVLLAELGGVDCKLDAGGTMDNVVSYEIKELGQHVLACAVGYRSPTSRSASASPPAPADSVASNDLQSFRKFYKFAVTNPLSVKTKVHPPRSPTATLSLAEREKLFLEVHIQSLTAEPLWFERMSFQPIDGWVVDDTTYDHDSTGARIERIYAGSKALMQPQDIRHYIYIMTPVSPSLTPVVHLPGTVLTLGRLDIAWRSSFGEPGHLLTSTLTRRIPVPQPLVQQPVSALPSYLKRSAIPISPPSRPQSPQATAGAPTSYQAVSRGGPAPYRSQSPVTRVPPPLSQQTSTISDIEVDLVIKNIARDDIRVERPFMVLLNIMVSALLSVGQERVLHLVVQHLQTPKVIPPSLPKPAASSAPALAPGSMSPRISSPGLPNTPNTPSPTSSQIFNYPTHQRLGSTTTTTTSSRQGDHTDRSAGNDNTAILPLPFADSADELKAMGSPGMTFLGPSAIALSPISLCGPSSCGSGGEEKKTRVYSSEQELEITYMPLKAGFMRVGGLRVVLVQDQNEEEEEGVKPATPPTLKEWDVIAEIWVKE